MNEPAGELIIGSIIGYFICLIMYLIDLKRSQVKGILFIHSLIQLPSTHSLTLDLLNLCILAAFTTYVSQCVGYIRVQSILRTVDRSFISPLVLIHLRYDSPMSSFTITRSQGLYGAYYSLIVFSFGIICLVAFQDDNYRSVTIFLALNGCFASYYILVAKKREKFSEEG